MIFRDDKASERHATSGLIESLWDAIQRTHERSRHHVPWLSNEAFIPQHRLEDWLFPVGIMGNHAIVAELLWLNDIPLFDYVYHPGRCGDSVVVLQGVSHAGAAAFLLALESYGLPIDPGAWIRTALERMPTRRGSLIEFTLS